MIITVKTRQNGRQLGAYLNTKAENETIRPLEIRGAAADNVADAVYDFSLQTENTKRGRKGLLHATINPDTEQDSSMSEADWLRCADVLEEKLGLTGQPRALVWHEKFGDDGVLRKHLHCVWQREKDGKLLRDSHSKRQAGSARNQLEKELGHKLTPNGTDIKQQITDLWNKSKDGAEFVKTAFEAGIKVARGKAANIFVAVDAKGKKQELARAIFGQKRADVAEKLKPIAATLPDEKDIQGEFKRAKGDKAKAKEQRQQEAEKPAKNAVKRERPEPVQQPEKKQAEPEQKTEQAPKENPFQRMLRQKREKAEREAMAKSEAQQHPKTQGLRDNKQGMADDPKKKPETTQESEFQRRAREAFSKAETQKSQNIDRLEKKVDDLTQQVKSFEERAKEAFSKKRDDHDLGHER